MSHGDEIKFSAGPFKGLWARVLEYNAEGQSVVLRFYAGEHQERITFQMLREWHRTLDDWSTP